MHLKWAGQIRVIIELSMRTTKPNPKKKKMANAAVNKDKQTEEQNEDLW